MPPVVRFDHNPVQSVSRPLTINEERYFQGFQQHVEESYTCNQHLETHAFVDCCDYCHDFIIYLTYRLEHRKGQYIDRKSHEFPFTLVEIPPWYPATHRILGSITDSARLRLRVDYKKKHGITDHRARESLGDHAENIPRVNRDNFSESPQRHCSNNCVEAGCAGRSETSSSVRRLVILQGRIHSDSFYKTVKTGHRWGETSAQQQTRTVPRIARK